MRRIMKRESFTLLEMLVVIAIIAILAALLLPAVNTVRIHAKKTKARDTVVQIANAWVAYYGEYRQFPTKAGVVRNITEMDADACKILIGSNVDYCTRGEITFLECSTNELLNGMADPWGQTYKVMLDVLYQGKVVVNSMTLQKDAVSWSMGPDQQNLTADDVTSWGSY